MRKGIVTATAVAAVATLAVTNIATATSTTKTETFTEITSNPGSGVASLIATGRFTAGGTALTAKRSQTLRFAHGQFAIAIVPTPGTKHESLNLTSCLYTKTGSGTYTFANGTGAYQGIHGSGKVSFSLRAVYPLVKGKCPSTDQPGGNGTPMAIQYIETGSGSVSLP